MRICSKAMFFDLSDNNFEFPNEVGGMYTYLREVTEHVHNMQAVVKVDLQKRDDLIGECNRYWNAYVQASMF